MLGFPGGSVGGRVCLQSGCDPWLGKIPWRSERLPTPVFWPGESHERPAVAICAPELLGRLPFWGMSPGPWPVVLRGQEPKVALSPTAKLA